jgi:hypothetical protein
MRKGVVTAFLVLVVAAGCGGDPGTDKTGTVDEPVGTACPGSPPSCPPGTRLVCIPGTQWSCTLGGNPVGCPNCIVHHD